MNVVSEQFDVVIRTKNMTTPNLTSEQVKLLTPSAENIVFLKSGGQKAVFSVQLNGVPYVLKIMRVGEIAELEKDDEGNDELDACIARAQREIQTMRECDERTLVKLGPLDLHTADLEGIRFLIYSEEFIDGRDLQQVIREDGRLSLDMLLALASDITFAIQEMWAHSKVHRDLKPANIMWDTDSDRFVLLDFGLALDLESASLTAAGHLVGTFGYFSPEQLDPASKRTLDFRSDFFALGIVLYEAATGQHPFRRTGSNSQDTLINILRHKPEAPSSLQPEISKSFCDIIMRLLAKRRHLRYRTFDQLLTAIDKSQKKDS